MGDGAETTWRDTSELLDGSTATCSSEYNDGFDAGFLRGLRACDEQVPRWDECSVVLKYGWNTPDRCGKCGEKRSDVAPPDGDDVA